MSLGLALSGGGARGAAHIGILRAFEEAGIKFDCVSGTSSGSIVAMLFSLGYNSFEIEDIFLKYRKNGLLDYNLIGILLIPFEFIFRREIRISGLIKGNKIKRALKESCLNKNISNINDTLLPLAVPAVDINTTETVMFVNDKISTDDTGSIIYINSAPLWEAVRSSIAFPTVFKPNFYDGRYLNDGGLKDNMPIEVLGNYGADKVIAIDLECKNKFPDERLNIFEIASQSIKIISSCGYKYESGNVRAYIINPDICGVKLLEFSKIEDCIAEGYRIGKLHIAEVKKFIQWD